MGENQGRRRDLVVLTHDLYDHLDAALDGTLALHDRVAWQRDAEGVAAEHLRALVQASADLQAAVAAIASR